jgi:hypothetical protein
MRTTLNFPDNIITEAKMRAVRENTTLTGLLVEGLKMRLDTGRTPRDLPVSGAAGGLKPGITWEGLHRGGEGGEHYR